MTNKMICDKCKKIFRIRNMVRFQGMRLCHSCNLSVGTSLNLPRGPRLTDEEAQSKVRKVWTKERKGNGQMISGISLPSNFIGKDVRVTIISEEELRKTNG